MRLYARPVVGDRRGAGLVEYVILVGLVALVAIAGFAVLGRTTEAKATAHAACVDNLACGDGSGSAATPGQAGVGEAAGTQTSTSGDQADGGDGDGKGFWGGLLDVGKGFVFQAWDTVKGLAHIVMHPVETVKGLWHAVTHPVQTFHAIKDAVVQAWNENPEEFVGRALFEIVTIPLSVGKLSKLKAVNAAKNAGQVAATADKVGDAAKVADHLSDAGKAAMRLDDGLAGSAVAKLKRDIASDPARAAELEKALASVSDEAIAGASAEAQLLRRELLSMSLAEREALMAAVKSDLGTYSGKVSDFLAANPNTKVKRVIIGGGPQGQNIANELHRLGDGTSTLVIDAVKGDQNFGSIRKFDLNSSRGHNPLYGSPVQAEDFSAATKPFPGAGDLGDASTIGLYSAMRRGTDVLTDTRVTNIVDGTGKNWPGRYRVDMVDANGKPISVYTDQAVVSTGLGKPVLPKDPASRAFAESEIAKLADNPEALKDVRVITGEDLLRASNHVTDEAAFYRNADGPTYFIGAGDAAKTAVEHFGEVTKTGARPDAYWVGVKPEDLTPKRYVKAKDLVESGAVKPSSGRLSKIEPIEGSNNVRLTFDTPNGPVTHEAGKVVMSIGMQSDVPKLMKGVVDDFDPKVNLEPVTGVDPKYPDPTLAKRVPGQDVYVVGIASGMERPTGVSFLEYFGHKNSKLAEQVLSDGKPTPSPIQGTRTPGGGVRPD
jgi:Flp pilus assembly pilin Flp